MNDAQKEWSSQRNRLEQLALLARADREGKGVANFLWDAERAASRVKAMANLIRLSPHAEVELDWDTLSSMIEDLGEQIEEATDAVHCLVRRPHIEALARAEALEVKPGCLPLDRLTPSATEVLHIAARYLRGDHDGEWERRLKAVLCPWDAPRKPEPAQEEARPEG